jgi:hypothetical protein
MSAPNYRIELRRPSGRAGASNQSLEIPEEVYQLLTDPDVDEERFFFVITADRDLSLSSHFGELVLTPAADYDFHGVFIKARHGALPKTVKKGDELSFIVRRSKRVHLGEERSFA